ncbi:MAG: CHAT domain-containing protein, partial [Desulfobacula sp.]|nr:CHAT domain-containing protein [Desulfobacula sp.]
HLGIALSYEGLGDSENAIHHFTKAIAIFESQWVLLGYSRRKNFLIGDIGLGFKRIDAYEGIIRVIIKQKNMGYEKRAFLHIEKLKSRTFLEMLTAKDSKGFAKEDNAIFTKDRWFQRQLSLLQHKANAKNLLKETLKEYEQFINEIKIKNIELASLLAVEVTSIEKIQSMIDEATTVLEYFVAQDKTYIWVLTKNDIKVAEIPYGELKLISLANDFLLPNISNSSRALIVIPWDSEDHLQIKETGHEERLSNRKRFIDDAQKMYHILIKPIERFIKTKRLIIAPHGVLHKIPFSGLYSGKEFMVEKYSICMIPSSTVMEHLVTRKTDIDKRRFLSFANPQTEYAPLDFADTEVENISKLFNDKKVYSGSAATESKVKNIVNRPDIIHFACHGVFDDNYPMQSGLLMTKDHENDGILQVHEIFGLNLKGSKIVVLSACETAIGKIFGGDDLVGLSRGFFYAGAASILGTLWEVDDQSTSILMNKFYENWQKKGMRKAEALRMAQAYIKSNPKYSHPFFWAPFTIIGDWN